MVPPALAISLLLVSVSVFHATAVPVPSPGSASNANPGVTTAHPSHQKGSRQSSPASPALDVKQRSVAVTSQIRRWPNGTIPYVIDSSFPDRLKNSIVSAMRQLEKEVDSKLSKTPCVQFIPRTDQENYVQFQQGIACHATVGFQASPGQVVSLAPTCFSRGTILHELMHVLGFHHEQNRSDRDSYVDVHYGNVPANSLHLFHKLPNAGPEDYGLTYDYGSILHYGPYFLAKSPDTPVIVPKGVVDKDTVMGQRRKLSPYDVLKTQKAYECPLDILEALSKNSDIVVQCHFSGDTCNMRQQAPATARWMVTSGPSANGPLAGHSTGVDSYLEAKDGAWGAGAVALLETPLTSGGPACLELYVFQNGPSSYLDVVVSGPDVRTVTVKSFKGVYRNYWRKALIGIHVDEAVKVKVTLKANVISGVIGVDDLILSHGYCGD